MKTGIFKTIIVLLALAIGQPAFGQVSGKITVTKDFYDALKAMHGGNLLKTALQLEVWRVQYFDVQTEQNGTKTAITRIYLQEKWSGASIPLTEEVVAGSVNLKFTIKNLPLTAKGGAKYALVYHLNAYPEQYKTVRFDEKGNDGSGRLNLRYQANFSAALGEKQAVGLTSLTSSSTQTYTLNLFSSTQVVAFGLLSDIGDFFSDAADLLWEGGKFLAGVVIDATGTILAQAYGIAQSLVLDDGVIIPRYRELTAAEYSFVNAKIFKYTLPPRDKIIVTNLLGLSKRPFTWALGVDGKIMMNLGNKGYQNATSVLGYYSSGERAGQILIHEMAHVWQLHHSDNISFDLNSLKNQTCNFFSDQYSYQCGLAWNEYNLEQQAYIVEACFVKRDFGIPNSCEEDYVVDNIREGVSFRTPECQKLVDDITAKNREINKRIDELKVAWLIEQGETVVMNADGTIKVGIDKGIANISLPASILNNDSRLTQLKAELAALEQRRTATNCR